MPAYAEVVHESWIVAPLPVVRAQFADLQHHVRARVHPRVELEILSEGPRRARYVQHGRLLGRPQRDVYDRLIEPDGGMVDICVAGSNKGGSLFFSFEPETRVGLAGVKVQVVVRLPLPRGLGWLKPLLAWQMRRELRAATEEDRRDIEDRGYVAPTQPAWAEVA